MGVLSVDLQEVCYFRQKPPMLIAKYHPIGNNTYCRTQMGLNNRSAICHSPTSASDTQVCIPESPYPTLPKKKKYLKIRLLFPDICKLDTGLRFRNSFTVGPQNSNILAACRGSQPHMTVVWAVPCTSYACWQAGIAQPLPLCGQKWWWRNRICCVSVWCWHFHF